MQIADGIEPEHRPELQREDRQSFRLAYSIDSFAKAADIGRSKIYEEIRDGRLQAKKLGSRTLITAKAASDYLSRLPDAKAA